MIAPALALACALHTYPAAGKAARPAALHGPGLFLDGGGKDIDAGWRWMHDTLVGRGVRGGNVLILRASGDNDYDAWALTVAPFASVRTILIPPCASPAQVNAAVPYVRAADAVFFAGGDQANYVAWKNTALPAAVRGVYARGGIVGGTSAGLAIQGATIYDSVAADRVLSDGELQTPQAVRDPFTPAMSFTQDLFHWPALRESITDTHFARRNRFGRLAAFLMRTGMRYGVAIDEGSALIVDRNGEATLLTGPDRGYATRGAYIVKTLSATVSSPGKPLNILLRVTHLNACGERYDLVGHRGAGTSYIVHVDGALSPPYAPRDPYGAAASKCY